MWKKVLSLAAAISFLAASQAFAGNIVLTGHDNDYHYYYGDTSAGGPGPALLAELAFVRNGSSLPVLTFDDGSELTSTLTALGISYTNVNPSSSLSASLFDPTQYSAMVVASNVNCGGCDNTNADLANIATQSAAIASFFNAGGGILGLAGASDTNAYAYVPEAATNAGGSPPNSGYVQTAAGATLGLPPVNGDPTHNFFNEPGTGGLASAYVVTERLTNAVTGTPETIALANGKITCTGSSCTIGGSGTSVPEPGSLVLLGTAIAMTSLMLRRRRI